MSAVGAPCLEEPPRQPRVHLILSTAILLFGLGMLGTWLAGLVPPEGVDGMVPVAPSTALSISLMALAMVLGDPSFRHHRPGPSRLLTLLVLGLAGWLLAQWVLYSAFGLALDLEFLLAPSMKSPAGFITGRMSPISAMMLFLLASARLLEDLRPRVSWNAGRLGQALALLVFAGSFVLITGYLFGAPPLYGGELIPVAFCTAMSCFWLATAHLFVAPGTLFRRIFFGRSLFSLMMSISVPGSMVTVLVAGLLEQRLLGSQLDPSFFLIPAVVALLSAAVVIVLSLLGARLVERNASEARAVVARARDELAAALTKMEQQASVLKLQADISEAFLTQDEPQLFNRILAIIQDYTGSRTGLMGLVDETGLLSFVDFGPSVPDNCKGGLSAEGFARKDWAGVWGHALTHRQPVFKNGGLSFGPGHMPLERALAIPLVYRDQPLGIITVADRPRDYDQRDVVEVESITGYLGAILQARQERRRAEAEKAALTERLIQAQKMESVGRLAGGVAHDFNNILTGISGSVDLGLMDAPEGSAPRAILEDIGRAAESAAGLTRQLLAFSRKQSATPEVLEVEARLGQMKNLLGRLLESSISLELALIGKPQHVRMDPAQFEQVLVNLVLNARDAMPGGGRIKVTVQRRQLGPEAVTLSSDARPGAFVSISVRDSGQGMTPEVMAHLFEPFFTTKELGRGTGLGLATTYGVVRQNEGFITVSSVPGQGSEFVVYLPAVDNGPAAGGLPEAALAAPVTGGGEPILLVDDDSLVRELTLKILQRYEYRVHAFGDPREALEACRRGEVSASLLLTDVMMPGMNGRQLAQELKTIIPGLRVLFASGYGEDIIAEDGILEAGIDFIGKPYSPRDLASKIREILDRP